MSVSLGDIMIKLIQKNLTKEELKVAESICTDFVKSNPIHEWCYRVWVKSIYEDADLTKRNVDLAKIAQMEEKLEMYERVFASKSDADEYMEMVKADLYKEGFKPYERAEKCYDCVVKYSTILFNHKEVRLWK